MYKENYVYLDIDESFYEEGDNEFMVAITYWDFGPDVGYFHFEYNSSDEALGEEGMKMKRGFYYENRFGAKMVYRKDLH